jgi:putative peptide maturation system protein
MNKQLELQAELIAAVSEALSTLVDIQNRALAPAEARRACKSIEARHPTLELKVIAEREPYTQTHHYELFIGRDGAGGVILSYCPDRGVPWMLRGAVRVGDDLLRCNGVPLRLPEAIQLLDIRNDTRTAAQLVSAMIIREALDDSGLAEAPVDDADLQDALDHFRRSRGLFAAAQMEQWLAEHGLDHETIERKLTDQVRVAKLRRQLTAGDVVSYFEAHRAELERAVAHVIEFDDLDDATEFIRRTMAESFHGLVERFVVEKGANYRMVDWRRFECPAPFREALFPQQSNETKLVNLENRFAVVRLLSHTAADELDEETRALVEKRLFERWLEQHKRDATIEWCWSQEK